MHKFPILIFDWSGVVSDDRMPVYEANMRLLKHYGKPLMTFEEWLVKTKISPREFLADQGVTENPEKIFEEYIKIYNKVRAEGIHPVVYEGAKETLRKLADKGEKLIVISSHPEKNLRGEAKEYGVEEYFSSFTGNVKDKTETIIEICKTMGVTPSPLNAAYIGDTIYDIQAAKSAGVYSVGISTGYHMRERLLKENPDQVIDSLSELL